MKKKHLFRKEIQYDFISGSQDTETLLPEARFLSSPEGSCVQVLNFLPHVLRLPQRDATASLLHSWDGIIPLESLSLEYL